MCDDSQGEGRGIVSRGEGVGGPADTWVRLIGNWKWLKFFSLHTATETQHIHTHTHIEKPIQPPYTNIYYHRNILCANWGHGGVVFRCTLIAEAICWRSILKFVEYRGPGEVVGLWNCFLFFLTCIEEGIQFQKKKIQVDLLWEKLDFYWSGRVNRIGVYSDLESATVTSLLTTDSMKKK